MALIRIEWRAETAVLFFARPPVNAFNLGLVREFRAALEHMNEKAPSGGVVVTGDGPAFSGGVDFKEVPGYTVAEKAATITDINVMITLLYGLPTATVAAVNGHAIGGGFVVMLACDVRLGADADAQMGLTEVTAGIPYPACPMEVVNAEIEPAHRRHLVLSGETIGPQAAAAHGLVDELVGPEQMLERAVELARSRAGARSYARVKEQLRHETLLRMRALVATARDPMLDQWV
jgi:enoyl-CoA hydratase